MNKTKTAVLAAAFAVLTSAQVSAADAVQVVMNGSPMSFEVPPVVINDRTMVPLRAIFERLGASVAWDGSTQTVTSTLGSITVRLTVGDSTMYINGTPTELDAPACIIDDRTMVPLRAVSEAYGADVDWDGSTGTVYITPYTPLGTGTQQRGFGELRDSIIASGEYEGGAYSVDFSQGTISSALTYDTEDDAIYFSAYTANSTGAGMLIFNDGTPLTVFVDSNGDLLYGIFEEGTNEFRVISNGLPLPYESMEEEITELIDATLTLAEHCFDAIGSDTTLTDLGVYRNTTQL